MIVWFYSILADSTPSLTEQIVAISGRVSEARHRAETLSILWSTGAPQCFHLGVRIRLGSLLEALVDG